MMMKENRVEAENSDEISKTREGREGAPTAATASQGRKDLSE